jgi:hypothetical protein
MNHLDAINGRDRQNNTFDIRLTIHRFFESQRLRPLRINHAEKFDKLLTGETAQR